MKDCRSISYNSSNRLVVAFSIVSFTVVHIDDVDGGGFDGCVVLLSSVQTVSADLMSSHCWAPRPIKNLSQRVSILLRIVAVA